MEATDAPEAGIAVDRRHWPLVVLRVGARFDAEDARALWESAVALAAERGPFANLIDCRPLLTQRVGPAERRALAELYRAHHEALRRTLLCEAWVHGSPLARGVLRAIHWLYRTPWPSAVYRTLPEAESRCVRALARHGLRPGGGGASARSA